MPPDRFDLSTARVLVSNDDGIHAKGLKLLEKALRGVVGEIWTVAPETEQSAASHSLTMRRPLRLRRVSRRRYTVDGTPSDCVLVAMNEVLRDRPPDLVLSGINRGGNMGEDAIYSGTVAAAREGALLGFRSAALSLTYANGQPARWPTAERWLRPVLDRLVAASWPAGVVMNVNFPDVDPDAVTGMEVTVQGRRKIGGALVPIADPAGRQYFWIGHGRDEDRYRKGTDLEAVNRGAVSVTPLGNDLTHRATMKTIASAFQ